MAVHIIGGYECTLNKDIKYFSFDSADDFYVITLRVDSRLFDCVTVEDCRYADCCQNERGDNAETKSKNSQGTLAEAHEVRNNSSSDLKAQYTTQKQHQRIQQVISSCRLKKIIYGDTKMIKIRINVYDYDNGQ